MFIYTVNTKWFILKEFKRKNDFMLLIKANSFYFSFIMNFGKSIDSDAIQFILRIII